MINIYKISIKTLKIIVSVGVIGMILLGCNSKEINIVNEAEKDNKVLKVSDSECYERVPFTSFVDGDDEYELFADTGTNTFKLEDEHKKQILLPQNYLPLKIISVNENRLVFCKKLFDETICLLKSEKGGTYTVVELPDKFKEFLFRNAVYFDDTFEQCIFFVAYNTNSCTNQLFRINFVNSDYVFDDSFVTDLNFGDNNIDENVKMLFVKDSERFNGNSGLFIMGTQYYYTYQDWSPFALSQYEYENNARLKEVYDKGKNQYYMTLQEEEDVFVLYNCRDDADRIVERCYENETGTMEVLSDGRIQFKKVLSEVEYAELFRKEISNLQCGGLIDMGSNNWEGRIPWSQDYYLNGLIDMLMPIDKATENLSLISLQNEIRERLKIEIALLDNLLSSELGMLSKRYSFHRADHISALHCQRILQMLDRYEQYSGALDFKNYEKLEKWALDFSGTIEQVAIADRDDINGVLEGRQYLKTRGEMLLDDVAAPYNFMSAYVSAVCHKEVLGMQVKEMYLKRAKDFVSILLESPQFDDFDKAYEWPYFYGQSYDGWKKGEGASHVPIWEGQTYTADISYRSMDSSAVIYAMKAFPELYDQEVIDYLRIGIESGALFPFVNEALVECGYESADMKQINKKYLRIFHSWNIQNAVWIYRERLSGEEK